MHTPRTEGLYRRLATYEAVGWMRFYATGEALSTATSAAPAAQIACWLRRGAAGPIPQGSWEVEGDRLRCTLRCSYPGAGRLKVVTTMEHSILVQDAGCTLVDAWTTDSSDPTVGQREGTSVYQFVPVAPRYLDGEGSSKEFRAVRSLKSLAQAGIDPAMIAALKAARTVSVPQLNVLESDELLALGLAPDFVTALLRWRVSARATRPPSR